MFCTNTLSKQCNTIPPWFRLKPRHHMGFYDIRLAGKFLVHTSILTLWTNSIPHSPFNKPTQVPSISLALCLELIHPSDPIAKGPCPGLYTHWPITSWPTVSRSHWLFTFLQFCHQPPPTQAFNLYAYINKLETSYCIYVCAIFAF